MPATPVNVSVIYYSSTGTTHQMAERLTQAAEKAGAEVRMRHVEELAPREAIEANEDWEAHLKELEGEPTATPDDIVWADVVLLGSPTRFGNVAAQLKQYLDTLGPQWGEGLLADKVYAGFTSTQTSSGGQESTLLSLYNVVHHFGGLLVAPGYTDPVKFEEGNPYGVSLQTGGEDGEELVEPELSALDHMAQRCVEVARALKVGREHLSP